MTSKPAALVNPTPTVKLLFDGKFIESQTSEWQEVVNPATQELQALLVRRQQHVHRGRYDHQPEMSGRTNARGTDMHGTGGRADTAGSGLRS